MAVSSNHKPMGIFDLWVGGLSIRPNFYATMRKTNRAVLPEIFGSCPNLHPDSVLMQKLWQNSSYLQLGKLNNCFYAAMTVLVQHVNICSPKLGGMTVPYALPDYAPGNSV